MGFKIKNRHSKKGRRRRKKASGERSNPADTSSADDGYLEVGEGDYCVMTLNRHDGSMVVHRFRTKEEAMKQHRRNIAVDKPLVGVTKPN